MIIFAILTTAVIVWGLGFSLRSDRTSGLIGEHRYRLQSAIARQARLRNTPELRFSVDTVIAHAARIEDLLAQIKDSKPPADGGPDGITPDGDTSDGDTDD